MKKLTLPFLSILLFLLSARGQSPTERSFVPNRPDIKSEFHTAIDPKKFKGTWISLDGTQQIKIYIEGAEVLVGGEYFPGVARQGDRATLRFPAYLAWMKKDPALRKIELHYTIPNSAGGGGAWVEIGYSPSTNHLIVGTPPYSVFENGQWVTHMGTVASNGIFGYEFERMILTNAKQSSAEFIKRRPDMKLYFDSPVDIKKFIGYWVTLNGDATLRIYQEGDEILMTGDYFPGVEKYGDKAVLSVNKQFTGQSYFISIDYILATTDGAGGSSGVPIVYSPSKDQLIVGPPPHKLFNENGQANGIAGGGFYFDRVNKEFKRVASNSINTPETVQSNTANPTNSWINYKIDDKISVKLPTQPVKVNEFFFQAADADKLTYIVGKVKPNVTTLSYINLLKKNLIKRGFQMGDIITGTWKAYTCYHLEGTYEAEKSQAYYLIVDTGDDV